MPVTSIPENEHSFDALFVLHQRKLYRYIAVLLPKRQAAEEAFQQACYILIKSRDKYDPDRDFMSWARGIARNVVREIIRDDQRHPLPVTDALLDKLTEAEERLTPEINRRVAALENCLERLRKSERSLLDRLYSGGETVRAIADGLKLTPNILYKRITRIRWSLHQCIERTIAAEDAS
jgi:RNA polymerase sigma-70 factor (ECF subfamily)